jgi:hypothetical protein
MKSLFVAQPFPNPPTTGSRNLIFHWLEAASRAAVRFHNRRGTAERWIKDTKQGAR